MLRLLTACTALAISVSAPAFAEMHEIQMLNRGSDGERMVFEPSYLQIAPGDTIRFLATDPSHNAQTVETMLPDGAAGFEGGINEEIEVTLDTEGWYGIQCRPHFAMGMVMVVEVGDAGDPPADFLEGRIPGRARARFEAAIAQAE